MIVGVREHLTLEGTFPPQSQRSAKKSRVTSGFGQSSRATPGQPLRHFFLPDLSATLAFCPLEGGSDEFVGVFGGLPARASSSAIRARSALMCSRSFLFWSDSSSIFRSNDRTSDFRLSPLSESIPSGGIPSLNHDAITWHRGTQRMLRARGQRDSGVSNYAPPAIVHTAQCGRRQGLEAFSWHPSFLALRSHFWRACDSASPIGGTYPQQLGAGLLERSLVLEELAAYLRAHSTLGAGGGSRK